MAVIKNIVTTIHQLQADGTYKAVFNGVDFDTLIFPHERVAGLMEHITGVTLEDEDHFMLNNLQAHGKVGFKFGPNWEWRVEATVLYPQAS